MIRMGKSIRHKWVKDNLKGNIARRGVVGVHRNKIHYLSYDLVYNVENTRWGSVSVPTNKLYDYIMVSPPLATGHCNFPLKYYRDR